MTDRGSGFAEKQKSRSTQRFTKPFPKRQVQILCCNNFKICITWDLINNGWLFILFYFNTLLYCGYCTLCCSWIHCTFCIYMLLYFIRGVFFGQHMNILSICVMCRMKMRHYRQNNWNSCCELIHKSFSFIKQCLSFWLINPLYHWNF